jgi:hypothetical protein
MWRPTAELALGSLRSSQTQHVGDEMPVDPLNGIEVA